MKRARKIFAVAVLSALIAWFGEPFVSGNKDFFVAVLTLFAVFGGFLVAVMSIGGEPLIEKPGTWRTLEFGRNTALHKLDRARLLFYVYLIASVLILLILALQKPANQISSRMTAYVDVICLWFTAMGLLFSFALPSMLIGIQQSRIDGEIERRRQNNTGGDA